MPTTSTAAVLRARRQPFTLGTLQPIDPGPGQVLALIRACGICHTDVGAQLYEQGLPLPQLFRQESEFKY